MTETGKRFALLVRCNGGTPFVLGYFNTLKLCQDAARAHDCAPERKNDIREYHFISRENAEECAKFHREMADAIIRLGHDLV